MGANKQGGYFGTIKGIHQMDGMKGFFRGWVPPFFGSVLYRSMQFAAFEAAFTKWEHTPSMRKEIPYTAGCEVRVVAAGVFGGTCRSLIECPFEYAKVKQQTGQTWVVKDIYRGFSALYPRSTVMMTAYFCQIDFCRRNTRLFESKSGQFLASGGASLIGWFLIWPFEVIKNMA